MDDERSLMGGNVPVTTPTAANMQLNVLLWGDSGAGKTTLAATGPGHKFFIMLDPGGALSLADRADVSVLDLSSESPTNLMARFRGPDPYDLGKLLVARPDWETVVIDSMTALAYAALQEAVLRAGGSRISIEQPGIQGYAWRNASVLRTVVSLMRICAQHKRHLILITHEGNADRSDSGTIQSVTMALSEGVANQVGLRFNEVLHLSDNGTDRVIAVRPCRLRKPMKSRMFQSTKPEFVWRYNSDTGEGEGLATWFAKWQTNGGKKIPLPTK